MFIESKEKSQSRLFVMNHILCFVVCLVGLSYHQWEASKLSVVDRLILEMFAPLQEGAVQFKRGTSRFFDHYLFLVDTRKQNDKLRDKIADLQERLFEMSVLQQENDRLKDLLNYGEAVEYERIMAQVIGWDLNNEFQVLRINKGSQHGIKPRMTVVTNSGLVGYTYQVSTNYTDILTILNQNNRVDVLVDRTRSFGVVEGVSKSYCRMKYVERNESIEQGDLLTTAGYGELYPKGLRVGIVQSVRKDDYSLTQDVKVRPLVDFQSLEEVLILKPSHQNTLTGSASDDQI